MTCELLCTDCFGRQVRLDHSNWQAHVAKRPEIGPHHADLQRALADPLVVVEASRDRHFHFYLDGVSTGRYAGKYLRVVVGYDGQAGSIRTCWISTVINWRGVVRWRRSRCRRSFASAISTG